MGLSVCYQEHGCMGTWDYTAEVPPMLLAVPFMALLFVTAGGAAWMWVTPELLPFGLLSLVLLMVGFGPKGSRMSGKLLSKSWPGVFDLLGAVAPRRRRVARFLVNGSWLEVRRDRVIDRVFLPGSRVLLHDHTIRIVGTTTDFSVEIMGSPGDEEALERLADTLRGIGRRETGTSHDVAEELRRLARPVPESGVP